MPLAALLGPLGPLEIGLILLIVIIVFGVGRLPEVGGAVGKSIKEFRKATKDGEEEGADDTVAQSAAPPAVAAPAAASPAGNAPAPPSAVNSEPAPVAADSRFCNECGTRNTATAKFCEKCGHSMGAAVG